MMNDELIHNPDDKLEDALAMLAAGVSIEEVLADAATDAEWLRPLLELASEVGGLQQIIPVPSSEASLQRLLHRGEELATNVPPAIPAKPWWRITLPSLVSGKRRGGLSSVALTVFWVTSLLVVCLVGALLGGGVALAAEDSLPDQPLYGVKRMGETVRLLLARTPKQRQALIQTFNQRRRTETELLLEQGRQARVAFEGDIESLKATEITVDWLTAQITPDTAIEGDLAIGARIQLEGMTGPDGLVALTIVVLEPAPPPPTPTVTATPVTPTTTSEPEPGSTSDTIELVPKASSTITPTVLFIEPTSTSPLPDDNSNSSQDSGDGVDNIPTPTDAPAEGGSDNDNDGGVSTGNDHDDENEHADDSDDDDDDNSGKGGGDDGDDDNSGKGGGDDDDG